MYGVQSYGGCQNCSDENLSGCLGFGLTRSTWQPVVDKSDADIVWKPSVVGNYDEDDDEDEDDNDDDDRRRRRQQRLIAHCQGHHNRETAASNSLALHI